LANRREFIKTIAGGTAALTTAACTGVDPGDVVPYLVPPDDIVVGEAVSYATLCRECPAGCGVLATVRDGRAVKVEGNPDHPVNRGKLCARGQAAVQGTYDADRLRGPLARIDGELRPVSWPDALQRLRDALPRGTVGWLGHSVNGSLDELIGEFLSRYPSSVRVDYEPLGYEPLVAAGDIVFGRPVVPAYDLDSADVVVSFGADFLETWISNVSLARQYSAGHRYREGRRGLYVHIAPRRGLTGENADRWITVRPGTEAAVAAALALELIEAPDADLAAEQRSRARALLDAAGAPDLAGAAASAGVDAVALTDVVQAFRNAERPVVLGGGAACRADNATALEVAVAMINELIGANGRNVSYDRPHQVGNVSRGAEVGALIDRMRAGDIATLLLHHTNPAFALPPESGVVAALEAVPTVVSFASYLDESTAAADLVLPDHTPLESWGDYAPTPEVRGLQQPSMRPLHETMATGEVLLRIGAADTPDEELFPQYVQEAWRRLHREVGAAGGFEEFWEQSLRTGGWFATSPGPGAPTVAAQDGPTASPVGTDQGGGMESNRRFLGFPATDEPTSGAGPARLPAFTPPSLDGNPDGLPLIAFPTLQWFDGRGANRPWLQELPDAVTKTAWGSWVELHPETAAALELRHGDEARVSTDHGEVLAAVVVTPSLRPGVAAMPLGQGHTQLGRYAAGRGVNPLDLTPLRFEAASGAMLRLTSRVTVAPTGARAPLAQTQTEETDHDRGIAQTVSLASLAAAEAAPGSAAAAEHLAGGASMYAEHEHEEHRWGMTIDIDTCIGCGACEVACAAENNIAMAGAEAVAYGREMSWIRIERYRHDDLTTFVPMLCQHCDSAPCESVCPVYATYHNDEGLNAMIYNRCVGTRYCSNNCPYKVRRFNWKEPSWPQPANLQLNPDVTVRSKGVMEKCTFCVQRIAAGKNSAAAEGRELRDGDVVPACAQTCPADAIVFGDLLVDDARVNQTAAAASERTYAMLGELGTRPAITYLKRVVNSDSGESGVGNGA